MSSPIEKLKEQIQSYIEARNKATEGPWEVSHIKGSDWYCIDSESHSVCSRMDNPSPAYQQLNNLENNFNFIALAANQSAQMASQLLEAIEIMEFYAWDNNDLKTCKAKEFLLKLSKGSEK